MGTDYRGIMYKLNPMWWGLNSFNTGEKSHSTFSSGSCKCAIAQIRLIFHSL